MQVNNPSSRTTKRMRLGTKSCAECRRRKVRCTFSEGQDKCRQCTLHKTVCKSQEEALNAPGDVQSRLGSIEESIRVLCQSLGQQPDQVARRLRTAVISSALGANLSESLVIEGDDSDGADAFDEAPLLQYLRGTLSTQSRLPARPASQPRKGVLPAGSINYLIPDSSTLVSILQYTQHFWSIWPLASLFATTEESFGFPTDVPSAVSFIDESLRSADPGIVAKCLSWFCICLQELPKDFENTTRLPLRARDLIYYYLDVVDGLFQRNSQPVCNLNFIQALLLQYELFIFMGRPCRAWKCIRTGLDNAMLLGLHRPGQSRQRNEIWSMLWQQDRHLSLFLGLPYAVSESYIEPVADESLPLEKRILHRITIICGHIIDRDQLQKEASYSTTMRIAEEVDQLRDMIPKKWWTPGDSGASIPFGLAFWRRALILFFHTTNNLLHLPYVAMAVPDKRYEYSRATALESAEGMVVAYQNIRALGDVPMSCDFLDFVAFSAAAILAADLVSQISHQLIEERRWSLVTSLAGGMRKTAEVLDCPVAEQSAEVLEYLHAAQHGAYTGPEHYEVTIPYFGRMRIRRPKAQDQQPTQVDMPPSLVELESNVFGFRLPGEFQTMNELGEDWTGLDLDFSYDWQGVFEFGGGP
ncbi:hypothetical protein ACJ41O_001354 [Fusarium nematophilum]